MQVKFREFIPSILNVSRQSLAAGEEDVAVIAFEIFDELIESPAPLLGESVRSIVQFSLEVCSSSNVEPNTRHQVRTIPNYLRLVLVCLIGCVALFTVLVALFLVVRLFK